MPNQSGVPEWDLLDRLHKSMRQRGVTSASDMALLLGMHRNSVQDYLNGKRVPDRRTMLAWAFATGVPLEWLETGKAPQSKPGGGDGLPRLDSDQEPSGFRLSLVGLAA